MFLFSQYFLLQELVKKYYAFINFPIHFWASKEVDEEVPADEDYSSDDEETCMHDICEASILIVHILLLVY